RRGELLGLRWSDIDDDGQQVGVRSSLAIVGGRPQLKTTKTTHVRRIHLDARTAAAVQRQRAVQDAARRSAGTQWRNELDLVFTEELGAPLVPQRTTHRFRRLVRRLDVPTIRLHDLRHTHATLLLQAGVPVKVVSERLGHASITITMDVYAHVLPAMDRDAADRYGALLE
ncbi:MAG TPA: site-specific integrase, partial [Euzebyales bacterium]|nr:site-specific integrase [Euzebyales bacterium]